ncbi:Hypothetical protein DHA2_17538 [Giardia duodenalis]|uniref:EF-hand domain-containing protein n=1 Tax=Giardia intestinalis TaxID=5741 RepID=V6TGX8_GIAIN|nr:Hypothetical protein DHA2_17538 [Giardia intestinalis]
MPPKRMTLSIDTHSTEVASQADQDLVVGLLGADVSQYAQELILSRFSTQMTNYTNMFFSSATFSADISNPETLVIEDTSSIPPPSPSQRNSATVLSFSLSDSASSGPSSMTMMSPRARKAGGQHFPEVQVPLTPSLRATPKSFDGVRLDGTPSSPHTGSLANSGTASSDPRQGKATSMQGVADDADSPERRALIDRIKKNSRKSECDVHEQQVLESIISLYPNGINLHTTGRYPNVAAGMELAHKFNRAQPEASDEVRIISDVLFESVLGIPGFLVWSAVPIMISHYSNINKDPHTDGAAPTADNNYLYKKSAIPVPQQMSREMIEYGPCINEMYSPETGTLDKYTIKSDTLRTWFATEMAGKQTHERLFNILRLPNRNYITLEDLERVAWILLRLHPGLSFLAETPQFQVKYAETVAARILFELDSAGRGVLFPHDLCKLHIGNLGTTTVRSGYGVLLEALWLSQFEADINRIQRFFSYEHFYVIYCKFWELDENHDQKISLEEFCKYGGNVINKRAAQRAFNLLIDRRRSCRRFLTASAILDDKITMNIPQSAIIEQEEKKSKKGLGKGKKGGAPVTSENFLTYYDFVCFILAEENRDLDSSLNFWFEVCDLDADGIISFNDFDYFYRDQLEAVELAGTDAPDSKDIFCQLVDQIKSTSTAIYLVDADHDLEDVGYVDGKSYENKSPSNGVTLQELRRCKVRGNIFDAMINFRKLTAFEARDPYLISWNTAALEKTPWDRFCKIQYDIFVNSSGSYEFTGDS